MCKKQMDEKKKTEKKDLYIEYSTARWILNPRLPLFVDLTPMTPAACEQPSRLVAAEDGAAACWSLSAFQRQT